MSQYRKNTINIRISKYITMAFIVVVVTLLCEVHSLLRMSRSTAIQENTSQELKVFDKSSPSGFATEFDNDHYNLTSNSAWASLIPSNRGILTPAGEHGSPKFQVALYQQLDCINKIRISVLSLYNVTTTEGSVVPDFPATERCFSILRQLLLCAADTTMETPGPPTLQADGTLQMGLITGLGVTHRCLNWEKIRSYVDSL